MSISQGSKITASDINSVNSNVSYSGTLPDSYAHIENNIGNNGERYIHRTSGQAIFQASFSCGWFGGGKFRVKKWVSGGWNETVYSRDFGWNTNETVTVNSTGPGRYRIYSETDFQFAAIPWKIWCAHNTVSSGEKIYCFDDFTSSGNKVHTGDRITVSYANAQKIGGPSGLI